MQTAATTPVTRAVFRRGPDGTVARQPSFFLTDLSPLNLLGLPEHYQRRQDHQAGPVLQQREPGGPVTWFCGACGNELSWTRAGRGETRESQAECDRCHVRSVFVPVFMATQVLKNIFHQLLAWTRNPTLMIRSGVPRPVIQYFCEAPTRQRLETLLEAAFPTCPHCGCQEGRVSGNPDRPNGVRFSICARCARSFCQYCLQGTISELNMYRATFWSEAVRDHQCTGCILPPCRIDSDDHYHIVTSSQSDGLQTNWSVDPTSVDTRGWPM